MTNKEKTAAVDTAEKLAAAFARWRKPHHERNPMIPCPYIPPNMIELLRAFEKASKEISELTELRSIDFRLGPIPRAWPRQWELDTLNRRRGELLPQIDERARQLLAGALDEFHGEDPTLAEEIQAFTLWKLTPRATV